MARNLGSLDTSVLVRLFVRDVPKLSERAEKLLSASDAEFDVPDLAVYEMGFVLSRVYQFSREELASTILTLARHPKLNCNQTMLVRAAEQFLAHPKLSFADCCLAEYAALNESVPLWTFDKKLASQNDVAREVE